MMNANGLSWISIVRLGLVQTALGAIVVLTTSTLNRVMVVELALPAILPGALVGFHYAVQILRPRWGYGSDVGGNRTAWIIGGMAVLCLGGALAAVATAVMASTIIGGTALAALAFLMIGIGVGAAGTSLLALLAGHAAPERRAAAATIVWIMMILGFIITAGLAGHFLDPFSTTRLVVVASTVSVLAFVVALLAVVGVEQRTKTVVQSAALNAHTGTEVSNFRIAFQEVWAEPDARHFTIFVFVSMLAYSAQDLILEPFAGIAFGMTPGQSTQLAGLQNTGVLSGMLLVALLASGIGGRWLGSLKMWTVLGCLASACALFSLSIAGMFAPHWPLKLSVIALGFSNGVFAVAAIGSMMALAGRGREKRVGTRMGIWGAAQAIAFGSGGLVGAAGVDAVKLLTGTPVGAYMTVFAIEACIFFVAAWLALGVREAGGSRSASEKPRFDPLSVGSSMLPAQEGKH